MKNRLFFSQYGEDKILSDIFPQNTGICVEIGANDGKTYSNSLFFENRGWKCFLVEPTPHLCAIIRQTRTAKLFECACSSTEGEAVFNFMKDYDLYSSIEQNFTMSHALESSQITQTKIKTRTLDSILDESSINHIDFITIDVEGHELSVLQGFTIEKYTPKIVIIEDDSDIVKSAVNNFMEEKGYTKFYRSGGNDWYAQDVYNIIKLTRKWQIKGLVKANTPLLIRKPLILTLRKFKKLITTSKKSAGLS